VKNRAIGFPMGKIEDRAIGFPLGKIEDRKYPEPKASLWERDHDVRKVDVVLRIRLFVNSPVGIPMG